MVEWNIALISIALIFHTRNRTMIRRINFDEFSQIENLLEAFEEQIGPNPFPQPVSFKDQTENALKLERLTVFAKYDEKNPIGLVIIGNPTSRISVIHVDSSTNNLSEVERELFDFGFEHLAKTSSDIRIGGRPLGTTLQDYPETKGFRRFDRKFMTLSREKIESLTDPILPEGYSFETYDEDKREIVADIVFKSNVNNIDVDVFPQFFKSLEASVKLLEDIEQSVYGKYKDGHSKILMHDGKAIGAIFLTMTANDTGYIPDICILPDYRGKGLGKAILIYSLKEQMKLESELIKNNLDVTKENPAKYLYERVGYEDVTHYSMYRWTKPE